MSAVKTLILIGPGKHFGLETAQRFAAEGFHIVLIGRSEERLAGLTALLRSQGCSVEGVSIDVQSVEEFAKKMAIITKACPPIAAVIYNAKASLMGNGLTVTADQLNEVLALNVTAAVTCLQALLPHMEAGSSYILTGGGYKDSPQPDKLALSVSKGALHTLFLALVEPLGEQGVLAKTLVIDGVVRDEETMIRPKEVADAFWELYLQKTNEPLYIRG